MQPSKLTADGLISKSISLLQALTASSDQRIARACAEEALRVSSEQLDTLASIVSDLCDSQTGARAVIEVDENSIALIGDAACLAPLRLNAGDAQVLSYVLGALNIDVETRTRIEDAVCPVTLTPAETLSMSDKRRYGSSYPMLSEAIADGVRCTIVYRSATDETARERTIDPISFRDEGGSTYLDAWDMEKDASRRYRLDRIHSVAFTDESVEQHPEPVSIGDSLASNATAVTLRAKQLWYAKNLTWSGIQSIEPTSEGNALVRVYVSREDWLFDEVLFSGGQLSIEEPVELRERFCTYANTLANSCNP